ncbi:hypothetical protein [Kineosporia sp. A_224]|uniref:hypothetical protein n=1 Tax=Kineosporia sp. A_224 TaxID=1962180 RepID=UPI00117ACD14|nr:hypothetical protein [Kineosporia sp. A_224]
MARGAAGPDPRGSGGPFAAPVFAWEIPLRPERLVAAALAAARPVALAAGPVQLNGMDDAKVTERYVALRDAVLVHAGHDGADLGSFERLESAEPGASPTWLETWLMVADACDEDVVRRAHDVWEALGPNAYAVALRARPRTGRGFREGRDWAVAGTLVPVLMVIGALEVDARTGVPWWYWLPLVAAWPVLVLWLFDRRRRRLLRIGGAELPHL